AGLEVLRRAQRVERLGDREALLVGAAVLLVFQLPLHAALRGQVQGAGAGGGLREADGGTAGAAGQPADRADHALLAARRRAHGDLHRGQFGRLVVLGVAGGELLDGAAAGDVVLLLGALAPVPVPLLVQRAVGDLRAETGAVEVLVCVQEPSVAVGVVADLDV